MVELDKFKLHAHEFITVDLLTVDELAGVLRVPKSWVYSRTKETGLGSMPRVVVGKYRRFVLADVMAWLEKQTEKKG